MDNQLYIKDVVTLQYDPSKCTGCGMCVAVCPHRVFQLQDKKAYITNKNKCMECGACELNCKDNAIRVHKGVGCATAVINSMIRKSEPTCGCGSGCN